LLVDKIKRWICATAGSLLLVIVLFCVFFAGWLFLLEVKDYSRLMPNGTFLLKSHIIENQYPRSINGGRALKSSLVGLKHYMTVLGWFIGVFIQSLKNANG
jgi:hypothetical protein